MKMYKILALGAFIITFYVGCTNPVSVSRLLLLDFANTFREITRRQEDRNTVGVVKELLYKAVA